MLRSRALISAPTLGETPSEHAHDRSLNPQIFLSPSRRALCDDEFRNEFFGGEVSACRLGVTEKKIDCIRQAGIEGLKTALAIKRLDAESLRHCHSGKPPRSRVDPLALLLAFDLVLGGEVHPLAASVDPESTMSIGFPFLKSA